jgi:hypothetical protein
VFPLPVPIGVAAGNEGSCSTGTIAARVVSGGTVYALSNNHVFALENSAPLGSQILQPGLANVNCISTNANVIGTLANLVTIDFSTSANNTVDAAIALSDVSLLDKATPGNGYGTPSSTIEAAFVGQKVQKYGERTRLTRGKVKGINATVLVAYESGTAQFVDQIIVKSPLPFLKSGDSGSLLVTRPGLNPVGLLFAKNKSGTIGIANRIDLVLSAFGVSIDGQ